MTTTLHTDSPAPPVTWTSARPPGAPRPPAPALTLAAALLGFSLTSFDASAVTIALPSLGGRLGGGMSGLQWVVDAYTLAFAGLMLSTGALADRIGAARAYGYGLGAFLFASVGCALAPSLGWLIGARIAQGAAAAVVLPASLSLVRRAYSDPARRARAVALWATGGSVAVAFAPVAGGALTTAWGWRGIFFANLPVGLAALALLLRRARALRAGGAPADTVPGGAAAGRAPLDLPGQVTAVLALVGLSFAVIEHGLPRWIALGVAVAALLVFLRVESRTERPVVPLGLLRERTVVIGLIGGCASSVAFFGLVFVYSLFFQQQQGHSALWAGLLFLPMTSLIAATNVVAGRLTARFGPKPPMLAGQSLAVVGALLLLTTGPDTPSLLLSFALVPLALGCALSVPALTSAVMDAVPAERAGVAAGVLNSARQNAGGLGTAVFGSLVATGFTAGLRTSLLLSAAAMAVAALATTRLRTRAPGVSAPRA